MPAKDHAIGTEQSGSMDFLVLGPSRRTVGGDVARLARPDDRHEKSGGDSEQRPGRGDERALGENTGRIGVIGKPPPEEGRRIIDRPSRNIEPWIAELGLKAKAEGHPLCRSPDHHQDNGEYDNDLAPEYSATTHTGSNRQESRSRSKNRRFRKRQQEKQGCRVAGYYRRHIGQALSDADVDRTICEVPDRQRLKSRVLVFAPLATIPIHPARCPQPRGRAGGRSLAAMGQE